ncbi:PQQ-dependent sugar dehydrogenase [Pedobacter nyackensis]|uniref:Glucose/arabinose dehydrogenase, beta-propeller fold n=1 Tax=Pedobacter nyackensis TaxID=475255 RepID=A0A1W2EU81_9SPHI|nr:PQQ-dependent sugar dehydrogenase [Pedobacter nyackensis]SMD13267.1 Glucose/arabinose dehydrogenase, beta-propeller fold [Pedobacter nyackensis]
MHKSFNPVFTLPLINYLWTAVMVHFLIGCNAAVTNQNVIDTPVEQEIVLETSKVAVGTVILNLDVPWEIVWGPDNWIWFTEQKGSVSRVNPVTGERKKVLKIEMVWHQRTAGLLGMAFSPDIDKWPYVVVDYTCKKDSIILSRLVRYTYSADSLINPFVLLEVPGGTSHNGSRLSFSADGKIFWATGDGLRSKLAQDNKSLCGKILRLNIDGSIPDDNPIKGSAIWASGYRNIQGLVYASNNKLYTSEHGDANDDEVNLIQKGGNYGWPEVTGKADTPQEIAFRQQDAVVEPLKAWTPTIAPAGMDYYHSTAIPEWDNSLILTTLKGSSLRLLKLNEKGDEIVSEHVYLDKEYGRLRDVCVSPAGDIYVSTSNRDWNPSIGFPRAKDDRILRLFKMRAGDKLSPGFKAQKDPGLLSELKKPVVQMGKSSYSQYCASCHKSDGNGVLGTFPPLIGAEQVLGDKKQLIDILLNGLSGKIKVKGAVYNQQMPAFHFLSDKEIAELLTYIRSSFGNKASRISATEVTAGRL